MPQRSSLSVLIAQINTTVGDFEGNLDKIRSSLFKAREAGAELVTFPELAVMGYPPEDCLLKEHFVNANLEAMRSILPWTKGLAAIVGFVDRDSGKNLYNAAALMINGKLWHVYRKIHLPNYGVFDEKRYFKPGHAPSPVKLGPYSLGITICEDIWLKESFVYQKSYVRKTPLLINISASPYHCNKQAERQRLVKRLALKTRSAVIYHNLVGGQDELVFDGGSMVLDCRGRILAEAKRFEEDFLIVDVPLTVASGRAYFRPPALKQEEEIYKALVLGTKDYVSKNRFKKVLVGLSGGIDSALVACIAVDALGSQNVVGVTMPSPYTSEETYRDAKRLAKNLSTKCLEFRIDTIFDKYLEVLKEAFHGRHSDTTEENLQARIRGNLLMALSNKFGYLVLTTGNKSEMATGYCTLYGDMAGGFAVIKDVPKTMVFRLARYRNSLRTSIIPKSLIDRPPTAELRHNQRDQDTLPPYAVLDQFLESYVEKDASIKKIARQGIPLALAKKAARMVDTNEYKRRQAPPGIKITPKAFGRDRRMPITNRYFP